jgi:diguanylate cyclase (GGDEF)-like protein
MPAETLIYCLIGVVGLITAGGGGFAIGLVAAPWFEQRAFRRALAQIETCLNLAEKRLQSSQEVLLALGQLAPNGLPTTYPREGLLAAKEKLLAALNQATLLPLDDPEEPVATDETPPSPSEVIWQRTPVDQASGLPDAEAFRTNFQLLLNGLNGSSMVAGLLLVQMDKAAQLAGRVGAADVESLQQKLGSLLVRGSREQDLVSRLQPDLFALLLPDVAEEGAQLAEQLRLMVRQHHFRQASTGSEVLVTASFGYADCLAGDNGELLLDAARSAMSKSQRAGRNQLTLAR